MRTTGAPCVVAFTNARLPSARPTCVIPVRPSEEDQVAGAQAGARDTDCRRRSHIAGRRRAGSVTVDPMHELDEPGAVEPNGVVPPINKEGP